MTDIHTQRLYETIYPLNKTCAQIVGAFSQSIRGKALAQKIAQTKPRQYLDDAQWAKLLDQCGNSIEAALKRAYGT